MCGKLIGREHTAPVRELLQAGGELRSPADPVHRTRGDTAGLTQATHCATGSLAGQNGAPANAIRFQGATARRRRSTPVRLGTG